MKQPKQSLLESLDITYRQQPWYGPSVEEVLQDISDTQAQCRVPGTHSINELVAHMISWRTFVLRRLQGDAQYRVSDDLNFPEPLPWEKTRAALATTQEQLLQALEQFPENRLYDQVPNSSYPYTFYTLLQGIIHHDIYHLGQIALLKKSTSPSVVS